MRKILNREAILANIIKSLTLIARGGRLAIWPEGRSGLSVLNQALDIREPLTVFEFPCVLSGREKVKAVAP